MKNKLDWKTERWIKDILSNDESSSDEELLLYFIKEGLSEAQAKEWLAKRDFYRLNIVLDDGTVYKPTLK